MEPQFYTFEHKNIKWTVSSKYSRLMENRVLRRIEQIPSLEKCKMIKRNVYRKVYLYKPYNQDAAGVYIKRYRIRDWRGRFLTRFRQSQAHREWKMMLIMREKGFPVPEPIALGERWSKKTIENYLVTLEIPLAVPLREATGAEKEPLLMTLALLANKLRKENIFYKDFQLGNLLLKKRGHEPQILLVDLHSARLLIALSKEQIQHMLAKLIDSFAPTFSPQDQDTFLKLYAQDSRLFNTNLKRNKKIVKSLAMRIRKAHLKSRTKRCLVKSTSFSVGSYKGWRLFHRREFSRESVLGALEVYNKSSGNGGDALKSTKRTSLSIVETPQGKVCVKHYRNVGVIDRIKSRLGISRAKRAWVIGNGLVVRNVPTSPPLALVEGTDGAFLLSTALVGLPRIDYYILEHFKDPVNGPSLRKKEDFIVSFAQAIRSLHDKKVYHGDLKACNILVKELPQDKWEFYFIDYDRVVFDQEVSLRRRIKNLAQLHTSIPRCITWADRLRFYQAYTRDTDDIRSKIGFLSEVMKESSKRIPVVMEPLE
ncbi:MAG: lipopolysaccharide kinase InaA family protein [Candidatus Brocadiales bacterium]